MRILTFRIFSLISAVLVYPVLIPIVIVVYTYRQLVKLVVQWQDPTYREILSGIGALIAGRDPYNKPAMPLVPYVFFSERVNRDRFLHIFTESIIKRKLYPELQQLLVRKWGYYFWKDVENFKLENHIRYLYPNSPEKLVMRADIRVIGENLVYSPFDERYSPWEILILPNVIDPENPSVKSAILIHFNHSLMDGLSLYKLLEKTASHAWEWPMPNTFSMPNTNPPKIANLVKSLIFGFKLVLAGPGYFLKSVIFSNDSSEFLNKALRVREESEEIVPWSRDIQEPQRISKSLLKKIAISQGSNLSSVITTIAIAGIVKFIRLQCKNGFSDMPKSFVIQLVLPLSNHPEAKLVNRWSVVRLRFTTDDCKDPVGTLKIISSTFKNLANSVDPMLSYLIGCLGGLFPVFLLPDPTHPSKDYFRQTVIFSNFPGTKSLADICGYTKVDYSCLGSANAGTAFLVMAQSLYDNFWIDLGCVSSLIQNPEDSFLFQNCFQDVIQHLQLQE